VCGKSDHHAALVAEVNRLTALSLEEVKAKPLVFRNLKNSRELAP